ncbi:MAG: hypothetical protein LPK58_01695, partial [Gammaproteobacteria bacterium]|nr:hypothetical protein [Gammaproteobacteria bacterium]
MDVLPPVTIICCRWDDTYACRGGKSTTRRMRAHKPPTKPGRLSGLPTLCLLTGGISQRLQGITQLV